MWSQVAECVGVISVILIQAAWQFVEIGLPKSLVLFRQFPLPPSEGELGRCSQSRAKTTGRSIKQTDDCGVGSVRGNQELGYYNRTAWWS